MKINYEITTQCNQNCRYCKQHDETIPVYPLDQMRKIVDQIFLLPKDITSFCFYGGEPTVVSHLFDLMKYVREKSPLIEIFIHSNMKKPLTYYQRMGDEISKIKIAASFQIHQMINPQEQVKKIIALHDLGLIYCCDFSLEYDNYVLNKECFLEMKKAGVLMKPMPIIYLKKGERKISEVVNKRFYADIMEEDKYCAAPSETKDKLCMAGYNYLFIRHNGDAIRCTTYRTKDPEGLKYGNLITSFDKVLEGVAQIQPCKIKSCTCPTELNLK